MNYKEEAYLLHYGILGMKWGKRSSSVKPSKIKKPRKEKVKNLSDDELRKRINRIQMEKQYSELSAGKIKKGQRVISKILTNSVKTAVGAIVVAETTKAIRKALT